MSSGGPLSNKGASSGRGVTVSTKGLVSQLVSAPPAAPRITGEALTLDLTNGPVRIVIPTAINVSLMMSENILQNMRVRESSSLVLPSLYKRAHLIAYETDEIATITPVST